MIAKMFKNYKERTEKHIENVQRVYYFVFENELIKSYLDDMFITKGELEDRMRTHDESKFSIEEMMGYILMTEKYNRKVGYKFTPEDDVIMTKAWDHHKLVNRHHPEYFSDIKQMMFIDLIEMVCDWGAMSLEFQNSLVEFKEQKAYPKYDFTDEQKAFIDFLCNEIEGGFLN